MNWKVGQKVVALCDVGIFDIDGILKELIIHYDETYVIDSLEKGCCMTLLDIGKDNKEKGTAVLYKCRKCNKEYSFKENDRIIFNKKWFKPFDDKESKLAKAARKIKSKLFKRKNDEYFVKIKIKRPIEMPIIEKEPSPRVLPKTKPELV